MAGSDPTRRTLLRATAGLSLLALGGGAAAQPFAYPGGAKGAVSLTYDDGLTSQLDHALPQLDARGMKATFFLSADNMEGQWDRWRAVAATGHEMANHTISHPCDLKAYDAESFAARELRPMESLLDKSFGARPFRSYAYPCDNTELGLGEVSEREARYGQLVERTFDAARSTDGPPNQPERIMAERYYLHGFEPTEHRDSPILAQRYLDQAEREGGWAILIFHEVKPRWRSTGDASAAVHAAILDDIRRRPLWCAPMGEAFRRLAGQRP